MAAWRSTAMLKAMGTMASATLEVGKVSITGLTANGLPFDAKPLRIWRVVDSAATINGTDAGPPAPLQQQARLGDFWIPQRGIFGDALTVDVDYYWNVALDGACDPYTDPELDMGQVSDDISSVHELAAQSHEEPVFIWYECEHLAGVLRAIAKTDLQ